MIEVVASWLPMHDPADDAGAIVRNGMNSILCALDNERFQEFCAGKAPRIGLIHAIVDRKHGVRWISAEQARWERDVRAVEAELRAWGVPAPRRRVAGITVP